MMRIKKFFTALGDWLFVGKRLPIIIAALIVIAVVITVLVVTSLTTPVSTDVTVYITVKGLGDDIDFENRQIRIKDGAAISDIFSLKHRDIYDAFGQPLIQYNEFVYFMGKRKESGKSFHVTIDGVFDSNLSQAYVYGGQTVVISYY